jgi:hypothetical protein
MIYAKLTTTKQTLKPNTKAVYITESIDFDDVTEQMYTNATAPDTVRFFKRLGGKEHLERSYTCQGYKIVKITSTSPDKSQRTIREYTFEA